MSSETPCCPAAAARKVRKLSLPDGDQVGIANLDGILKEVADLKLDDEEAIEKELLARLEARNYVPSGYESAYSWALLQAYKQRSAPRSG